MGSNAEIELLAGLNLVESEKQLGKDIANLQKMIVASGKNKINLQLAPLSPKAMTDFTNTMNSINAQGKAGQSVFQGFGSTVKDAFAIYGTINLARKALYEFVQTGEEMIKTVKSLDDANVSLQMATGESYEAVKKLLDQYNQMGQMLGAITTDVSSAADAWLRQGHSIADTNTLIKDSMILSKVANISSADSTKYLTSAMQGYKTEVKDVVGIVDKLTAVDLESATSAGGLAEAMSKTATGADIAGISMDRLIGMTATVGEVTQKSMSSIGESFKTIFSRMRSIKEGKLSLIGDEGEIEDISNVEIVLNELGIKLRDSNKEFRNFQNVLDDVAKSWSNYSSVDQAAISQSFSGTRQQENFLTLMENWDKVKKYTDIAADSAGTSTKKFEAYLDSLEAKTNELKASFEALANTTISKELYESILETSKSVVDFTNETGLLKGALASLGTVGAVYAFQQLSMFVGNAALEFTKFSEALTLIKTVNATGTMTELKKLTGGLSTSQTKLLLSTTNLTNAQRIEILTTQGLTEAEATNKLQTMGLATANGAAAGTTTTLSGALKGLWATLMANPLVLVATGVTAGIMAFTSYENHIKKVKEETEQAANQIRSNVDEIISKFDNQKKTIDDLKGRFTELSGGVDEYGNNVSLTNEQMDEYHGLVKKLVEINPSLVQGYNDQNEAIINKNTALKDTIDLLEKERKLELEKEVSTNNLETVGKNAVDKRNDLYGIGSPYDKSGNLKLDTVTGQAKRFGTEAAKLFNEESVKAFYDYTNSRPDEKMYGKSDWLKTFGFDVSAEDMDLDIEGYLERNIGVFSKNMDDILKNAGIDPNSEQAKNLKLYIQEWKALDSELKNLDGTYIDSFLQKIPQLVDGYGDMTDAQKSFINNYIKDNFTADDLENNATKVKGSIIGMVENISNDPKVQKGINDLFALNTKNLNVEDYVKQYNELINQIVSKLNLSDSDANLLRFNLTVDSTDLEEKYNNAITSAKEKFGKDETDFFTNNSINTKEEIDRWLEIAQGANNATEAERKYVEQGQKIDLPLTKEEVIANVNSLADGFESLDKIMASMADKDNSFDFTLLDDKKFKETFGDYKEEYANFVETISSSPKDVEGAKSAFNDLATALIDGKLATSGYTEENAKLITSMLRNMGITNAEEVVTSRLTAEQEHLAAQKAYNTQVSNELANATANEIPGLIDEATQSDIAKVALAGLALEKANANGTALDTSGDIDNIIALTGVIGSANTALQAFNDLKTGKGVGGRIDKATYDKIKADAQQELDDAVKAAANYKGKGTSVNVNYGGAGKTNKASAPKKEKKETSETFDWIAVDAEKNQKEIEKLQNQITDAKNWKSKNKLTDTTLDEMSNQLKSLEAEADAYQKKAESYDISPVYLDKIKNGSLEIEDITDELVAKNVKGYQDMYKKAEEFRDKIDDVKKSMRELAQTKLDNIINDFDSLVSLMEKRSALNKSYLELQKDLGEEITNTDYEQLISQQRGVYDELQNKYSTLSAELSKAVSKGTIKVGEEAWNKYNQELIDVNDSMIDIVSNMNDFRQSMIELPFKELERVSSATERLNDGISTMTELIGDEGLTDKGMITSKGLAKIALLGQQYANAKQQAANYADAIDALEEMYSNGSLTQDEYNERLKEYTSAQLSAVQATKQSEDAIIQFRKNAIQEQITNMNDLISAKKEALQAEKDYQDYLDSVNKKQTDINNIQAKIDELSLRSDSSDRAAYAMKLQLEKQLKDAKDELAKQQADNAYNQQLDSLDKQAKDYEDAKNNELKELETSTEAQRKVVEDYLGQVKDNYKTVYNTLTQYGKDYGVKMTSELTSPWDSASSAVDTFQSAVSDAISQINIDIASIDLSNLTELVSAMNGFSGGGSSGGFEDITGTGTWRKAQDGQRWWYGSSDDDYASDGVYTIGGKQYGFDDNGYMLSGWSDSTGDWRYFEPENGQMVKSTWRDYKGKQYYLTSDGTMATDMAIKDKSGSNKYYYVDDDGAYTGQELTYDEVKRQNITVGYKDGTLSSKPGLKWVDDGDGAELIRTPDGTLLRSAGDDVIFDADRTRSLYDMSFNPAKYIMDTVTRNSADLGSVAEVRQFNPVTLQIDSPLMVVEGNADEKTLLKCSEMIVNSLKNDLPRYIKQDAKKR